MCQTNVIYICGVYIIETVWDISKLEIAHEFIIIFKFISSNSWAKSLAWAWSFTK